MRDLLRRAEAEPEHEEDRDDALNVCVVTETFPPEINGVTLTLGHLVSGLRSRGHRVSLVRPRQPAVDAPGDPVDPALTLVPGLALPGYAAVRMGLPAGARLRERWRRRPPDAIYVATEGPLGWSAVRAARRLPVVLEPPCHDKEALLLGFNTRNKTLILGAYLAIPTFHLLRAPAWTAATLGPVMATVAQQWLLWTSRWSAGACSTSCGRTTCGSRWCGS